MIWSVTQIWSELCVLWLLHPCWRGWCLSISTPWWTHWWTRYSSLTQQTCLCGPTVGMCGFTVGNCGRGFSDDSAVVFLITDGDNTKYRELTQGFVEWCQRNRLQINAGKTKELVVDFHRCKHSSPVPVNIQGMDTEMVKSSSTWVFTWIIKWTGLTIQMHFIRRAGGPPEDLFWLRVGITHLLCSGLLGKKHLNFWQEET